MHCIQTPHPNEATKNIQVKWKEQTENGAEEATKWLSFSRFFYIVENYEIKCYAMLCVLATNNDVICMRT